MMQTLIQLILTRIQRINYDSPTNYHPAGDHPKGGEL